MSASPARLEQLGREGMAALGRGDAALARRLFAELVALGDTSPLALFALAQASLLDSDAPAALAAANQGLLGDPRNLRGLLVKADALDLMDQTRAAVAVYAQLLALADGAASQLPPAARAEIDRARGAHQRLTARLTDHLMAHLAAGGFVRASAPPRFAEAIDILTGASPRQDQRPRAFFYPGLAPAAFLDTGPLAWAREVEAATGAVRAEFEAISTDRSAFSPYLEDDPRLPKDPAKRLVANADWSACYLVRDGARVEANAARCPATLAALAGVPLEDVPGRAPFVLFSSLAPGAWIEPHTGFLNTRLVCHLPLVVPPGCSFRVGNQRRGWQPGQLMVFDDTLEHEARNAGSATRTVLIFNIWRPELDADERHLIRALLTGIDSYGA
jgi:hypothetical protein